MIVTVTANPAYDATYELEQVRLGEVQRVTRTRLRPGGKGLNVAAVLAQLGEEVLATGFASPAFAEEARACGFPSRFVTSLPHVRRTLVLAESDRTTGLWEPGVPLPDGATEMLLAEVHELLPRTGCLVVSGSLPPRTPDSLPADLARVALDAGVPAVVDTSGPALREAAGVRGVVLMPNADELAELAGATASLAEVVDHSTALVADGAQAVVATRGADGLVVTDRTGSWAARLPDPVRGNPTGAGDAAAAAVARGLVRGLAAPQLAAEAVALSAAAVTAPVAGDVDTDHYRELRGRVEVRACPSGRRTAAR